MTPRRSWLAPPHPPSWPWASMPSSIFSPASPCPAGSAAKPRAWSSSSEGAARPTRSRSPLPVTLQQRVEAAAEADHLGVGAREPGPDPVRALEEGQWGLALPPVPDAEHEAAGVDEAHILQHTPGGRQTDGDGTEPGDGGKRFRHAAEAEGVGAPEERGRQRFQDAPHREAGEHRIVDDGQGSAIGDANELLGQARRLGADQAVAAPPVLDPREPDPPHARKPSGPRVERPGYPLARPA